MAKDVKKDAQSFEHMARSVKDKGAVQRLLASEDTKRMMNMLGDQTQVQSAAKAAAAGDPAQLMGMMQQLMSSKEGAALVEKIKKQAQESGL